MGARANHPSDRHSERPMYSRYAIRFTLGLALSAALLAAACDTNLPDARRAPPPSDGPALDTRVPSMSDAAAGSPDSATATAADAPMSIPDAPAPPPDAPLELADAPLPLADAPAADASPDAAKPTAGVILNEVAPDITGSHDLVELLVTRAGSTGGIELLQDFTAPTVLAKLPAVDVVEGDLIVVHLNPAGGTVTSETTSKSECGMAACYGGAWDLVDPTHFSGIAFTYHVLWVRNPDVSPADVVPFFNSHASPPGAFAADMQVLATMGVWTTPCPDPCDATHIANLQAAAVDWSDVANTATGATVQRQPAGIDTHAKSDWQAVPAPAPNTLGAAN
jgi:hypothetical protein